MANAYEVMLIEEHEFTVIAHLKLLFNSKGYKIDNRKDVVLPIGQ